MNLSHFLVTVVRKLPSFPSLQPEGQHLDLVPTPPDDGLLGNWFCSLPFHSLPLSPVFPPSVSPQGNCGVIYEVLAAWSRPVYGTACWPSSIELQTRGPGLLLSYPQSASLSQPGPPSWLHSPCSPPQHATPSWPLKDEGESYWTL